MTKTEIYGTLGPACAEESILSEMLSDGMTGVRLNLSHMDLTAAEPMLRIEQKYPILCFTITAA